MVPGTLVDDVKSERETEEGRYDLQDKYENPLGGISMPAARMEQ
jgi:hypothetical protein